MVQASAKEYVDGFLLPELRKRFAWVDLRVLDAADYGVPQRRRRVIIAAGPHAMQWPEPTHSGAALAMAKWVTGDYWREWPGPSDVAIAIGLRGSDWSVDHLAPTLRDGNGTAGYYLHGIDPVGQPSRQERRWLAQRQQVGLFASEPPEFARKPWRTVRQALGLSVIGGGAGNAGPFATRFYERNSGTRGLTERSLDDPSPTVLAKCRLTIAAQVGGGAGNAGPFVEGVLDRPSPAVMSSEWRGSGSGANPHKLQRASDALYLGTGRRRLTVEECATLQGFPAGYPFQGNKAQRYRQVGNAVPPKLAQVLAGQVMAFS